LALLRGARRIWAIGAIHGDAARLKILHDRMGARLADGDRIVYLGNYLGHGAAIVPTIDELLDFRRRVLSRKNAFACDVVHLRGAQEEMWHKLLQLQFAPNPAAVLQWMVALGLRPRSRAMVATCGRDLPQPATGHARSPAGPARYAKR